MILVDKHKPKITKPQYTIKQIFTDNWQDFLDANPDLNIRNTIYDNLERFSKDDVLIALSDTLLSISKKSLKLVFKMGFL